MPHRPGTRRPATKAAAKAAPAPPPPDPSRAALLSDETVLLSANAATVLTDEVKEALFDPCALHTALTSAVQARRVYAKRCACNERILRRELQQLERSSHAEVARARAETVLAEARTTLAEQRAAIERRLFAQELSASEQRVVRLCHRLHHSAATTLAYHSELQQVRRAAAAAP